MIHAIDHIALAVADIDAAGAQYEALLGRAPSWRGAGEGVEQIWFQFPNMALVLMGRCGSERASAALQGHLDLAGEGLYAIAFATDDIDGACAVLRRRGVSIFGPELVRAGAGDQGGDLEWKRATVSAQAAHGAPVFLIERVPNAQPRPLSPALGGELSAVLELDHIVIHTPNPDRAAAFYGARLGLDLRLDRKNEKFANRLLFFKVGGAVIEMASGLDANGQGPDQFGGLAWRVREPGSINARLAQAGFDVSDVRPGRKPGTAVFTVRDHTCAVATIMIEQGAQAERDVR